VLEKHWPGVHRCREIRDFPEKDYGAVTLVSGGFPCQPFSTAGKRRGAEDDRYLWPEMLRVIREVRPAWVLAENVPGILAIKSGMVFESVLAELEAEGYETWAGLIPAAGVGANHRRNRVFVVAWHTNSRNGNKGQKQKVEKGQDPESSRICQDVADTEGLRRSEIQRDEPDGVLSADVSHHDGKIGENVQGCGTYEGLDGWKQSCLRGGRNSQSRMGDLADGFSTWLVEPNIPRVAKGVKDRVSKLRALGNAVVPAQVYPILKAIAEMER